MKTEAYINKIIEETGLTKKEIQRLVEEKKEELKGLISDEGALFIIAKELGVDVKEENKDLKSEIHLLKQKKDSHNSSIPPSKDENRIKRTKSLRATTGKKQGGQLVS